MAIDSQPLGNRWRAWPLKNRDNVRLIPIVYVVQRCQTHAMKRSFFGASFVRILDRLIGPTPSNMTQTHAPTLRPELLENLLVMLILHRIDWESMVEQISCGFLARTRPSHQQQVEHDLDGIHRHTAVEL